MLTTGKNSWFVGCHHFGHSNVLKFDKRPFVNITKHDQALIENHNRVVKDTDNVFFLGDFSFIKGVQHISDILESMNGRKHLIVGNHDQFIENNLNFFYKQFANIVQHLEVKVENQIIILNHYPMFNWNKDYNGSWMLHSHNHGKNRYDKKYKLLDVGIMNNSETPYTPFSYYQIERYMKDKVNKEFGNPDNDQN